MVFVLGICDAVYILLFGSFPDYRFSHFLIHVCICKKPFSIRYIFPDNNSQDLIFILNIFLWNIIPLENLYLPWKLNQLLKTMLQTLITMPKTPISGGTSTFLN